MTMLRAAISATVLVVALMMTVTPSAATQLLIGPHAGFQLDSATSRSFTESFEWQLGAQVQFPVFSLLAPRAGFDWHPKVWARGDIFSGDIYGSRRYVDVDVIVSAGRWYVGAGVYWVREPHTEPPSSIELVGTWDGFDFLAGLYLVESGIVRPFVELNVRQPFDRGNSDAGAWRAALRLAVPPWYANHGASMWPHKPMQLAALGVQKERLCNYALRRIVEHSPSGRPLAGDAAGDGTVLSRGERISQVPL